ncbi:MAG: hypothetical protein MUC87_18875 [Bacteroidia bacterium]|nr:hypothetical protein [Bacteroidia bacterium]
MKYALPVFIFLAGISLASCGGKPAAPVNNTDSVTQNGETRGLTVNRVSAPVTKKVSDSIFNGDYIERYDNGIIFKRGYIQGGEAQGTWRSFHRNGKLYSQGEYKNGIRQGYAVTYDEAGNMTSEGYYKDGKQVGKWKYDLNGVKKEVDFGGEVPAEYLKK